MNNSRQVVSKRRHVFLEANAKMRPSIGQHSDAVWRSLRVAVRVEGKDASSPAGRGCQYESSLCRNDLVSSLVSSTKEVSRWSDSYC